MERRRRYNPRVDPKGTCSCQGGGVRGEEKKEFNWYGGVNDPGGKYYREGARSGSRVKTRWKCGQKGSRGAKMIKYPKKEIRGEQMIENAINKDTKVERQREYRRKGAHEVMKL